MQKAVSQAFKLSWRLSLRRGTGNQPEKAFEVASRRGQIDCARLIDGLCCSLKNLGRLFAYGCDQALEQ